MKPDFPGKFPAVVHGMRSRARLYQHTVNGKVRYTITYITKGGRKMEYRWSWDTVAERVEQILADLDKGLERRAAIPTADLEAYLEAKTRLGGIPVHRAVDFYLAHRNTFENTTDITVSSACALFRKSRENYSDAHRRTLHAILLRLETSCGGRMLASLTARELDRYLEAIPNARTRHNHRATIRSLWNWCKRKGWLPEGVVTAIDRTERPFIPPSDPKIISPTLLENMLHHLEKKSPRLVPWIVLGAFAGIREAERMRLSWGDVDWTEGTVRLASSVTKTRRRRVVQLPDNALAWLKEYRGLGKIVGLLRPDSWFTKVKASLGVEWPSNALRHSFVTYHYMLNRNAALTAAMAGHSVAELESSYNGLATRADAEKWFGIYPFTTQQPQQQCPKEKSSRTG